jgi:hypothetical protein
MQPIEYLRIREVLMLWSNAGYDLAEICFDAETPSTFLVIGSTTARTSY